MHNEHMGITCDHCTQKGLEVKLENAKKLLPIDAKLRLVCDYCKLNQKLPADFWNYDKEGRRIMKQGINVPHTLPCIDKMLTLIKSHKFLTNLDWTGVIHGLKVAPDAAKKSAFIAHLGKFQWYVVLFRLSTVQCLGLCDAYHCIVL